MKHILFLLSIAVTTSYAHAKSSYIDTYVGDTLTRQKKCEVEEEIYEKVDEMPEFPGGLKELLKFLSKTIYVNHIFNCESGKATVSFVVEKDGSISNPTVVRNIDPKLDSEAIRMVGLVPKWKPGKHQG